jgi:hypothetical protein
VQGEISDPAIPNIRIVIPTAWGCAERPEPTGTIHELTSAWLFKIKDPIFSEDCLYDNHRVARVNVLVFEFLAQDFDRTKDHLLKNWPLIKPIYEVVNDFLARLRVYARLPQIRTLVSAYDPWQVQFLSNDRQLLPEEEGKLRMMRNSSVELGVFAFTADAIKTVSERWTAHEPYIWDQLLLDAHSLWPNVGSSIVMAFSALETFIAWALETIQSTNHPFPDEGWKWITNRSYFMKDPSVEEQYDALLSILAGKSLKSDQGLWTTFKELKEARNRLAHEGLAILRNGTPVDAAKARMLIDGAARIIEWVEALLPEAQRRHNKGFATPVARRFVNEEQAVFYKLTENVQDGMASDHMDEPCA